MRLSKTTNYAIRILLDCAASDGHLVKVAEISERRDVTLQNTFKIVHLLSQGRLPAGGTRTSWRRPSCETRCRHSHRRRCQGDGDHASRDRERRQARQVLPSASSRPFDQLFDDALDAFISVLDGHTLQDMMKAKRKAPATEQPVNAAPASPRPR